MNTSPDSYNVAPDELRQIIERLENLIKERGDISAQITDVKADAKARGYDAKIIMKVIALRALDPDKRAEQEAVMDMYKSAVGMQ